MPHRNQPRKNAQQGAVVCVWHSVCWERVSQTSDSPWTQRPAKLRETRWLKGEQSGGGDDGHLRATVVTDTHLLDFIFLVRETFRLTDEGRRRLFLTSLRLNSKSGCGSEGIHNLHPLSDWSSDYYVRWRQLKVTKLGFISPCVCVCLLDRFLYGWYWKLTLRPLKVITETLARLCGPEGGGMRVQQPAQGWSAPEPPQQRMDVAPAAASASRNQASMLTSDYIPTTLIIYLWCLNLVNKQSIILLEIISRPRSDPLLSSASSLFLGLFSSQPDLWFKSHPF